MILDLDKTSPAKYFILFLLFVPVILWLTVRLILSLLTWYLNKKYRIKFKFVGIRFLGIDRPSLELPNGFKIVAESAKFSFHFLNLRDIRFNLLTAVCNDLKLITHSLVFRFENGRTIFTFEDSAILPLTSFSVNHNKHLYSTKFQMVFDGQNRERSFIFTGESYLLWSPKSYLDLLECIKKIKYLWNTIKQFRSSSSDTSSLSSATSSHERAKWKTIIKIGDDVNIGALVSNDGHTIFLNFSHLLFEYSSSKFFYFKINDITSVVMDGHTIGKFDSFKIEKYPEKESSMIFNRNRLITVGLDLDMSQNTLVVITINRIKLVFPYRYNFAYTFNEKFVTIIKWLKKYHNSSTPEPSTLSEKSQNVVQCDIFLRIGSFSMEIGDDPFEVKLRDNYELMRDEYFESKKRRQMWTEKIKESKKKHMTMTEAQLNELYAALSKKQENVYIERHRKLYSSSPPRTHLFLFTMENIDLKFAADTCVTGYDTLIGLIKTRLDRISPLPPDLKFVTLWGRFVQGSIGSFCSRLRDFPKPLFEFKSLKVNGLLIGAEKSAALRSRRDCFVDVGPSRQPFKVERSMNPLKLYYDLDFDVSAIAYTHGASWEPVLQQLSLCFENIIKPSADPSPTLPWWDRVRLLLHGILRVSSSSLSLFLHASLNPYNSTELIEFAFKDSLVEWPNGKIVIIGNVSLLVHTASKYDDRRILNLPHAKITVNMFWECLGNPFEHNSVAPHAADKVPEYSIHQKWDSYRAFRSQSLKLQIYIKNTKVDYKEMPSILLFSSTLKWLENQKAVFRGIARLTRRGKLFGNVKPKKKPFTRMFKEMRIAICLKRFKVYYWSSLSKQLGFECTGSSLTHSAHHNILYLPFNDGLCRRPRPVSYIACMNSEVSDVEVWLIKNVIEKVTPNPETVEAAEPPGVVKNYFFSFLTMSYNRASSETSSPTEMRDQSNEPTHRLVVHSLKGAWTKDNRDIVVSLFDLYMNAEQLKRNLSTDALKALKIDGQNIQTMGGSPAKGKFNHQGQSGSTSSTTSPASTLNKNYGDIMLQKYIAESENISDGVYFEDSECFIVNEEPKLRGISACSDDDYIRKNWLIELVNSQVMLKGCETSGYVIVSAAKTQIIQKLYIPVWKDRVLLCKTALVGSIECMQYYATVDAQSSDDGEVNWLSVENIEEKHDVNNADPPDLLGTGQSSGGVVSFVVGKSDILDNDCGHSLVQLQRIISRCSCQFYYVNYSKDIPPEILDKAPPLPDDYDLNLDPWDREIAVDSFTMNHHDLEIYTNSHQFAMIMDLVNNLLLYVEPHKRQAFENLQRMKFKSVLDPTESLRGPILTYQDSLRAMITRLKQLEKDSYFMQKNFLEEKQSTGNENEANREELLLLEKQIKLLKEKINRTNEELTLIINLFKESQLADKSNQRQLSSQDSGSNQEIVDVARRIEICFKQACWKLTDSDGQMSLAKVELNNFIYTKAVKSDDSFEHSLELGFIKVSNSMPNQKYPNVLEPVPSKPNIPVDIRRALRIYCRESPPQNGIPIKEHFEVNVIPLAVMITSKFNETMKSFFFDRDDRNAKELTLTGVTTQSNTATGRRKIRQQKGSSGSNNSIPSIASTSKGAFTINSYDDVEKMRQRAQKSKTFAYIKLTEVPLRVTYRGTKDKNLANVQDMKMILSTVEYHNQTWEWLDLVNAIKREAKHRLLSQVVKHKFGMGSKFTVSLAGNSEHQESTEDEEEQPQKEEERKASLLIGEALRSSNKSKPFEKTLKNLSSLIHGKVPQ